ncbi:MAG: radical SAM protein [Chlorobium sp.]|nr:MAG: radical SAM protein [Chlorobium sp.]
MSATVLSISEIFHSIQGEGSFTGWPCAFIRLAGCGHGCAGCDTGYAEDEKSELEIEQVIQRVLTFEAPFIEITGGEPLLQPAVYPLMTQLCDLNQQVLLETGGFISVEQVDKRVHKIIDLKPPSSGVAQQNHPDNILLALEAEPPHRLTFEFKIIIAGKEDYEWATSLLHQHQLTDSFTVMMGVSFGKLDPAELAAWMLRDRLKARLQLQLHKYLWDPSRRGV